VDPWRIRDSVSIEASPQRVWDLLADVTRMGQWSPETTKVRWIRGCDAPLVGAKFRGSKRQGLLRWSTTCEGLESERGRAVAF
jgi:uncharacterized protein YndB with AHSA1/START domain